MNLSRMFIERPVMTALACFAILLFGVIAFRALPVAALPSVDYPTIQVNAAVPGANPDTDRKSTRLNSSHLVISYAVFCLQNKKIGLNSRQLVISYAAWWLHSVCMGRR